MSTPVGGALAVTPLYATAADAIVSWDDPGQTWRSLAYLAVPATIALTGDVTGSGTTSIACAVVRLQGRPLAATAPGTNQVIQWSGTQWQPATLAISAGTVTSIAAGGGITVSPSPIVGAGTVSLAVPVSVANGGTGTGTALTPGSVVFAGAGGAYAQDNANLFWDDGNNRLGVGTASPATALDVAGTIRPTTQTIPTSGSGLELNYAGGVGFVQAYDRSGIAYRPLTLIGSVVTLAPTGSAALTVVSGGNVGIGTTGPATILDVSGTIRAASQTVPSSGAGLELAYAGGSSFVQSYDRSGGAYRPINVAGSIVTFNGAGTYAIFDATSTRNNSGAWATISDRSMKENVVPYTRGLEAIVALNPVMFRYLADSPFAREGDDLLIGLLADEVQPHVPEIVGSTTVTIGKEEAAKEATVSTLEPGLLVFSLINSVKTLAEQNATLAARLEALEKPL